jgi:hypothetical protein
VSCVLIVVGVAEEADGIRAALDALDEDVVIFGELNVRSIEDGGGVFVEDDFDEVVEGAGVGAGDVAQDGLGGPGRIDIGPGFGGGENQGELFEGHVGDEVILSWRQRRRGHRCLRGTRPARGRWPGRPRLHLSLDGAGSVGNIGLTGDAEALEASARADGVDGDIAAKAFVLRSGWRWLQPGGRRWSCQR